MIIKNHPVMHVKNENIKLWRYMDFTKFMAIIENKSLVFPNADSFEDPYEGAWPQASIELIRNDTRLSPEVEQQLVEGLKRVKNEMFISCWYMSDHESAAMWDLYLNSDEGVSIETDSDSLFGELGKSDQEIYVTEVGYLNYDVQAVPLHNIFYPFTHKRKSFQHENELRAIIYDALSNDKVKIVEVDPVSFIKAIHISPRAPVWFADLVKKVVSQTYGLSIPVIPSSLYKNPTYNP